MWSGFTGGGGLSPTRLELGFTRVYASSRLFAAPTSAAATFVLSILGAGRNVVVKRCSMIAFPCCQVAQNGAVPCVFAVAFPIAVRLFAMRHRLGLRELRSKVALDYASLSTRDVLAFQIVVALQYSLTSCSSRQLKWL